ncbi:MAG: ankyrin repeat domain-containing protein [Flavobacteriales bacterium]|nr:ankyrin repeat domain-containing protein [Flavobacteriales bacterium]
MGIWPLEIVEFLLHNGADPKIKAGFSADTALLMAKQHGFKEIVTLLKNAL